MRTSFLQDLYLQKPISMIVIICAISVLPWISMGDFSTKGQPREATVAMSMLETGNFILPASYANEFAFKPPMTHWLIAIFSLPQGGVSEFTSRLPAALAFIMMIVFVLSFFGKRIEKIQEIFITVSILITCIEIHRAAMTTRVDMLLTAFIVIGLIQLYRWEEIQQLKGLPIAIPILLGCAVLTKGPVGVILPLFVFLVYLLLLNKYRFRTIVKVLFYIGISSLFLPFLWYIAAWKQGGDNFLNIFFAENFGRFFHITTPNIHYELGHGRTVWYNFVTLFAGLIPWTLFLLFSLFGIKIQKPNKSLKQIIVNGWTYIRSMDKVRLFSLVVVICVLFFYSIPSSKRSVYLMPAYPFLALFIAQYMLYLTEYRKRVTHVFAIFIASLSCLALICIILTMTKTIDPVTIVQSFTSRDLTLHTVQAITTAITSPKIITIVILMCLFVSLGIVIYQLYRKINIKILYATITLMFCINLFIDGVIMPAEQNSNSSRPFAEKIMKEYPIQKNNVYVMDNLREYHNLYGLNFYMGNIFQNFEDVMPKEGFFLAGDKDMIKIKNRYGDKYTFCTLTSTSHPIKELRQRIVLSSFTKE